jgi:SAM-dependent methyltransferase
MRESAEASSEEVKQLGDLDFLSFRADFSSPRIIAAYDELPLWSAMFGLLLDEVPLSSVRNVLDVGGGTGFPLIKLAERLGLAVGVHGVDVWTAGLQRCREKVEARATGNIHIHETSAGWMPFANEAFDLIVSNLGVNNFVVRRVVEREVVMRFANGAALFSHHFIKLGFLEPWKSRKPLTGRADGGEQERRCAILLSGSGSRYPYKLWCLVPVWKSGSGRLRPRRW